MNSFVAILIGVVTFSAVEGDDLTSSGRRLVCYYNGTNSLSPEDIDASLCTHLIYKSAVLDSETNEVVPLNRRHDLEDDGGQGLYGRTVALKRLNSNLKVLLGVGTWEEGSLPYSLEMASTGTGRARFVRSAVEIIQEHGFDGMSLDWEYPGRRGGMPDDLRNYELLIFELRIELDKRGLFFSGLLPQNKYWLEAGYDIEAVKRNFHFICINTYNYWGPWWDYTGIAAPIQDVESSINLYLSKKVPGDMIVVGIPAYAQTATLAYSFKNQRPQIIIGPGDGGPDTRTPGKLGYGELLKMQRNFPREWAIHRHEGSKSLYAVRGHQYISYDDPVSVEQKALFIARKNLGGAMIMSIDQDDISGIASNETFSLTRTVRRVFLSDELRATSPATTTDDYEWLN